MTTAITLNEGFQLVRESANAGVQPWALYRFGVLAGRFSTQHAAIARANGGAA